MAGREPAVRTMRLYGAPSEHPPLDWSWVEEQLERAGTYWVLATGPGHPHPRPVWAVWQDATLHLSIGSPVIRRQLAADPTVTVHLDSGIDTVIVEGYARGETDDAAVVAAFDRKYDYDYDVARFGPLIIVEPARITAWQLAGPHGKDGFQAAGGWSFGP